VTASSPASPTGTPVYRSRRADRGPDEIEEQTQADVDDSRSPDRYDGVTSAPDVELTLRLGSLAHRYGLPAYELDDLLAETAAAFGLTMTVISTPACLDITIDDPRDGGQRRLLVPLDQVSYNLQKLSHILELAEQVRAGEIGVDDASQRLDEIDTLRPPYPVAAVGVAYAACGAGFAVILSAAWLDVAVAAVLSLIVFALGQASERSAWLAERVYVISAFVASALASTAGVILDRSNTYVVALCAFVVLIPGLGLTLGTYELATGHTLLGWNRLIKAAVRTFALFAGASLAAMIVRAVFGVAESAGQTGITSPVRYVSLVVLMLGLVVVFQVMPRQAPVAVVAGVLAYGGLDIGGRAGTWQGPFLGALVLGLFAALSVKLRHGLNPLTVLLPGIMILVPGVAAYSSLRALDSDSGSALTNSAQGVLVQIVSILAGLFVASSLLALGRENSGPTSDPATDQKEAS
jgi:uncharacterized membrane protein YjjP (DUF1212 family)